MARTWGRACNSLRGFGQEAADDSVGGVREHGTRARSANLRWPAALSRRRELAAGVRDAVRGLPQSARRIPSRRPRRRSIRPIAAGQIAGSLPFVKKTGIALLKAAYASQEEAAQKIQAA